jgi:hypothetical protein
VSSGRVVQHMASGEFVALPQTTQENAFVARRRASVNVSPILCRYSLNPRASYLLSIN